MSIVTCPISVTFGYHFPTELVCHRRWLQQSLLRSVKRFFFLWIVVVTRWTITSMKKNAPVPTLTFCFKSPWFANHWKVLRLDRKKLLPFLSYLHWSSTFSHCQSQHNGLHGLFVQFCRDILDFPVYRLEEQEAELLKFIAEKMLVLAWQIEETHLRLEVFP